MLDPIIIIGTGLAGYALAKEIRKRDTTTPVLMFTQDKGRYYSKPLLSTACAQKKTIDALIISSFEKVAASLQVDIFTEQPVIAIDCGKKQVKTKEGTFVYSKLVFACGAKPNRLSVKGNVSNIHSINNLMQYEKFRATLKKEKHNIVIIGAGLVGCEFANDLVRAGHTVSVITPQSQPLEDLIPKGAAEFFIENLSKIGIHWILNTSVTEIHQQELYDELILSNGQKLKADTIISAIGIRPNIELAQTSGIAVNKGIVTDAFLKTNKKDVFALGDCAEIAGRVRQFIAPISHAAKALAATITNHPTAVRFPIMPIVVKTPDCPVIIVPPLMNITGSWNFDQHTDHVVGKFFDTENKLKGFILLGKNALPQRVPLMQKMEEEVYSS